MQLHWINVEAICWNNLSVDDQFIVGKNHFEWFEKPNLLKPLSIDSLIVNFLSQITDAIKLLSHVFSLNSLINLLIFQIKLNDSTTLICKVFN